MIGWSEQQLMIKDMVADFVQKEIVPHIDDLEYNGMPPYDILRKLFSTFGMDEMAGANFDKRIAREEAIARGEAVAEPEQKEANDGPVSPEALDAVAMATPIAHKGATAGAKVMAMTALDLYLNPDLQTEAKKYFDEVQQAEHTYTPFISDDDPPAIHLNAEIMDEFREEMKKYYYDPEKYDTYLEQLGIDYPQLVDPDAETDE